jgi:hypothetical protein
MAMTKTVRVPLTEEEILDRAQQMAALILQIRNAEEEKKELQKAAAEDIKSMEERLQQLSHDVRQRSQDAELEVEQRADLEAHEWVTTRVDTGEEIEREAMTDAQFAAESQQQLFDKEAKAELDAAAQ